jgi:basic membrane protein A
MTRLSRRQFVGTSVAVTAILGSRFAFGTEKIKVACVHASPIENAWNSVLHSALTGAAKDGVIDYVFSEGVAATDYPRAMREYADQGCKLIVGESYAVETEARQVAVAYPKTNFLMGSSGKPAGGNFGVFAGNTDQSAYLAGLAGAKLSKTGIFGSVGGYPIPEVNSFINAFRVGVREVRPDAKFLVGFLGTWFDPAKAKETGLAQIDAGADLLLGERIGTVDAAADRGKLAVGSITDFRPKYPKTVYADVLWIFRPTLDAAIADTLAGKPTGRDYAEYSLMAHGGNDCVFTEALVTPEILKMVADKKDAIKSGAFKVPLDRSEPT